MERRDDDERLREALAGARASLAELVRESGLTQEELVRELVPGRSVSEERMERLEALAEEVRRVVQNSGWRDRNLYWPEGMHLVETRLRQLDRHAQEGEAQRERARERYGVLFDEVAAVLVRHDPVGLAALGAPQDEYEPEASTILPRLERASSERETLWVVREEFARWFPPEVAGPKGRYEGAASEIWSLWRDRDRAG